MLDILFYYFFLIYFILTLAYISVSKHVSTVLYLKLLILTLSVTFIMFLFLFKNVFFFNQQFLLTTYSTTFFIGTLPCNFSFNINMLSYAFSSLVMVIGLATNLYTLNYFKGEANEKLFIFWLNAFILSMLLLVFANNFFTIFLGWELIGLTSFFLINFWNTRRSTVKSSFKAFTFNLISDICLLASFAILYSVFKTDDVSMLFYLNFFEQNLSFNNTKFATILLILAASLKSVQLVAHLWLPDSMEAPVPASSLIHSATLVSAGIYLICKFNFLIICHNFLNSLILLGSLTACYGGVVAAAQTDLKKLLAYSTMSHCGFLWILAATGNFYITILYLVLHGIFKAATFYFAGSLIRLYGTQDSRWMGNSFIYAPVDGVLFFFASFNLCGLPFSFGFLYKSFFFKLMFLLNLSFFNIGLLFLAALSSLLYFFKLNYFSMFDFDKTVKNVYNVWLNKTSLFYLSARSIQFTSLSAITVLIIFVSIFILYWNFFYSSNIVLNNTLGNTFFLEFFVTTEIFYTNFFLIFYLLYAVLFLWLTVVTFKNNTFSITQQIFFIYIILICLFLCELT